MDSHNPLDLHKPLMQYIWYIVRFCSLIIILGLLAMNQATKSVTSFSTAVCSLPLVTLLCARTDSSIPWDTEVCSFISIPWLCPSEATDVDGGYQQAIAQVSTIDIHRAVNQEFKNTEALLQTSYRFNDALSHDVHQVLIGVNQANTLIKRTDLPPNEKAIAYDQLVDIRTAAHNANGCVQSYLAKMHHGIAHITASASHTSRQLKEASVHSKSGPNTLINISPYGDSFSHTMQSFRLFSSQLSERNDVCQVAVRQLQSKLDKMMNTFVNDAFSSARQRYEDSRASIWSMVGRGKAASERAGNNIERVDLASVGINRLLDSTVLLELHLQQLRAGAVELSEQAEQVSDGHLTAEEVIELLHNGCMALNRQVAQHQTKQFEEIPSGVM